MLPVELGAPGPHKAAPWPILQRLASSICLRICFVFPSLVLKAMTTGNRSFFLSKLDDTRPSLQKPRKKATLKTRHTYWPWAYLLELCGPV